MNEPPPHPSRAGSPQRRSRNNLPAMQALARPEAMVLLPPLLKLPAPPCFLLAEAFPAAYYSGQAVNYFESILKWGIPANAWPRHPVPSVAPGNLHLHSRVSFRILPRFYLACSKKSTEMEPFRNEKPVETSLVCPWCLAVLQLLHLAVGIHFQPTEGTIGQGSLGQGRKGPSRYACLQGWRRHLRGPQNQQAAR